MAEVKFPTEVVDLPSKGLLYPKDSPLSSGKVEVKYMTAREEDILTSVNLIKKGLVVDKLLQSLIVDDSVKIGDLLLGDKNAILIEKIQRTIQRGQWCKNDRQGGIRPPQNGKHEKIIYPKM